MVAHLHSDPLAALAFLEKILSARTRLGVEAALCLDMDIVIVKLKLGETKDAKEALEAAKEITNTLRSTEPVVFSRYFMAVSEYRKVGKLLLDSICIYEVNAYTWVPIELSSSFLQRGNTDIRKNNKAINVSIYRLLWKRGIWVACNY